MRITTKAYGQTDVDERQILVFPRGLLGFEQFQRYALLDASQQPFYWLQSVDMGDIAFILIDPHVFRPDYSADPAEDDLGDLELESPADLLVFAVVTIPENQLKMTANLQGPILVNRKKRIGRQIVSLNPNWHVRHPILEELAQVKEVRC
jgi:flagellar assembly factor FliW